MPVHIRTLGLQPYEDTWQAMQNFTSERSDETDDQIWLVTHPPVFTQGLNGDAKHLLVPAHQNNIPIIQTDRGGQVTYHGPGQAVVYLLLDLKRAKIGVRDLVSRMENAIIDYLGTLNIDASARKNAPGVYVNGDKIASLGLKIRKQRTYHGLALNLEMDMSPFHWITPCGLEGIQMTQVANQLEDTTAVPDMNTCLTELSQILLTHLEPEISG
jgi:lipoyl(octanoyl) transferase